MANSITVSEAQAAAADVVNTWSAEADAFLQTLRENTAALIDATLPDVSLTLPQTPFEDSLFARLGGEPVAVGDTTFNASATEPGAVSIGTVAPPSLVQIPDYNVAAPAVSIPSAPQLTNPVVPASPVLEDVALPVSPTLDLPTAPTLSSVVFPDTPVLSLPTFSESAPDALAALSMTDTFEYQDEAFDSTLLDAIRTKLTTDVEDGGYGIEPADEASLWDRARDRSNIELDSTSDEIAERYASRGFDVPPGALLGALNEAAAESRRNLSELNREISVERARLFRDNRQFAMNQGLAVEQARLTDYGFRMERALNAQRFAAEYMINVHDLKIRDFNARLARYNTIAEVYRTQLQGALTQIQIYEAEVRAAVSKLQANQIDVDLYRALLDAATTRVGLYEAQTRAASLAIDIQQAKVDAFRAEVQAFVALIDGNRAQLDVYTAGIQGEQAKVNIFRTEVDAYSSRVSASATEQSARNAQVATSIETKRLELQTYEASIARHRQAIVSESARIDSILRQYATDTDVYSAAIGGYEALGRVDLSESTAQIQAIQEQTRRLQANAQLEIEAANATLSQRFQASNAGSNITTGIIEAANSTYQALVVEELSSTA